MLTILSANEISLPDTAEAFLQQLPGPVAIEVDGDDTTRTRVVSTLIHGNEPSGFFAAFEFLKKKVRPHTRLIIIISSVRAAKTSPEFTHRFVPGEFDLNRRFGINDCHDRVTELARQLTSYLQGQRIEWLVDLHNTSGRGPSFAVATQHTTSIAQLAAFFTQEMVVTHLIVGSLMEQDFGCPVVTIECGGAQDAVSHDVAFAGLVAFSQAEDLPDAALHPVTVYQHPFRVKAMPGISLTYNNTCNRDFGITLLDDIERHNFELTEQTTPIGWLGRPLEDCIEAIDESGNNRVEELFELSKDTLLCKKNLRFFMATRRVDIALSDCLFYVIPAD